MASKKKLPSKTNKSHLHYKVVISDPHLNYFHVELTVKLKQSVVLFHLPTWTPGSYLIRDYAGHLHNFSATSLNGAPVEWRQTQLSTWEVKSDGKPFLIKYRVYSFENSVRTNFLDSEYGFINPPSLFLFPENYLDNKIEVLCETNGHFKYIYSSLERKENLFFAANFDLLYDAPIQFSNRESVSFESGNCQHEVLLEGEISNQTKATLVSDLKKITDYEAKLFGANPNKYYLFIINLTDSNYGGLEHSASSVNAFDPNKLHEKAEYAKLLGLLAHEYFHLWNVKRIRPIELLPFDYLTPNLTRELWIAEGITSFYDNYILHQCNFFSTEEYLAEILSDINRLEDSAGDENMSLEDSSFTAWTKFYKQQANSHNTGISYYIKGSILVFCMNIYILKNTDCKFSFIDILKAVYHKFYVKKNRGFTKQEFFDTAEEVIGINLLDKFEKYISDTVRIPVFDFLEEIGVKKEELNSKISFGFETKERDGRFLITKIYQHKSAGKTDINLQDELIAINGQRASRDILDSIKASLETGEEVTLLLSRKNRIIHRSLKCETVKTHRLVIDNVPSEKILKLRKAFLGNK
ncbi:MAG: M61 family metallopeptidase [Leptospiraceae bacterium]|nr:M61 family metallopeptidase [Leptospiraceae bacterium]